MNAQLVEALAQTIQSLNPQEKALLADKVKTENHQPHVMLESLNNSQERHFYETATPEEWIKALWEWSESHRRDIPLLSDESVSRRGIYEGD